jgi:hypothetical protein
MVQAPNGTSAKWYKRQMVQAPNGTSAKWYKRQIVQSPNGTGAAPNGTQNNDGWTTFQLFTFQNKTHLYLKLFSAKMSILNSKIIDQ